jgi:hypothetical protein
MKIRDAFLRTCTRARRCAGSLLLSGCACIVLVAGLSAGLVQQQTKPQRRTSKATPAPAAAPPPAAPFHAGETLDFTGEWLKINNTITARLIAVEQRVFFGKASWHLQAQLHTNNPLRLLFPLDDQFDSYAAVTDMQGFQFEMYLNESGKSQTNLLRFSSGADAAPVPPGATIVRVPPGTRDPLGFFYDLRSVDWKKTAEVRSPVFDGHNLYDVRAQLTTPAAATEVAAGKFTSTGIGIHVYQRGAEMTDTKLTLWIAQDAAHTPVLLEMELPIGYGRIELVHDSAGK